MRTIYTRILSAAFVGMFLISGAAYAQTGYQLTSGATITRLSDSASIPSDPANTDYAAYLAWKAAGNTALPVPAPSAAQVAQAQYSAAIAAGIAVTSTGSPALNGTYAVAPDAQAHLNAVATYIAVNSRFPRGASALTWFDLGGAPHTFTATATFQAFASALADYVTGLEETSAAIAAGQTATWPAATATIP